MCKQQSNYLRRLVSPLRMKPKLAWDFPKVYWASTPEACSNFNQENETVLCQKLTHFSNTRHWSGAGSPVIILSQIHRNDPVFCLSGNQELGNLAVHCVRNTENFSSGKYMERPVWKGQKSPFFPGIQKIKSEIINNTRTCKLLIWMKD